MNTRKLRYGLPLIVGVSLVALMGAECQPAKTPVKPPATVAPGDPGVAACPDAAASTVAVDFEDYLPGSVNNQDGWVATGAYDQAIVSNAGFTGAPAEFGAQSWRISNAVTSGSFGDQPFSKPVDNEAGESTADNGNNLDPPAPQSGGTRQPCFEAEFTVASTTGAAQNGARFTVSPDRGDGARMSFLALAHVGGLLDISFSEAVGTTPAPPCTGCANFTSVSIGSFDPTIPHTVRINIEFVDGDSNDIVQVFVDGVLEHTGTSWEDYYRFDGESNAAPNDIFLSRTVDSLLFRLSGTAAPTANGQGFLIDDLSIVTGA